MDGNDFSHESRKGFVEPQLGPPLHRDDVAEPLMSHLWENERQ